FVFQNVSGSEAPAEFTFYLPAQKAFCGAELLSRNMHNLYTLRGAKVRDALAWSGFIDESASMFAEAEIYFASHHWPIWGQEQIADFLEVQSDTYKYIHDQTLRLAHQGYTPLEIIEELRLPDALQQTFSNRGYYGTVRHNSRAVYQGYFGWYDGNPANLNPLPPVKAGKRYVAAMGGADNVLQLAEDAFAEGDYRWVAQLLNHLVFAEPDNQAARALLARNYDQLGYQAESGPWRDVYLTGAYELRHGNDAAGRDLSAGRDMVKHSPRSNFFDAMAAQLNGPEAEGMEMTINFTFTDLGETHVLRLKNSVLHHHQGEADPNANTTLNITHDLFLDMALGSASLKDMIGSDQLSIDGSKIDLARFFALQEKAPGNFSIVLP
ncbi:MAG: alkyl sulfatase dimerization domain-containing protein, partial [Halieaceae bacterium]